MMKSWHDLHDAQIFAGGPSQMGPEGRTLCVIGKDDNGAPFDSAGPQSCARMIHKRTTMATAAMILIHREMIEISAPGVVAGHDRADDFPLRVQCDGAQPR